jgi:hypothetical protein
MRHDDVIVGARQGALRLQVVWGAGAGLHLAAHAARVWTHGQVVAFHTVGSDDTIDR